MRKKVTNPDAQSPQRGQGVWLDLEKIASVEVTSEDPNFPIDSALESGGGSGWRAAEKGRQTVRLLFDKPITLHRIRLEFVETELERTQEFTLRWCDGNAAPFREIVRQQWNFSPQGSTSEIEDYQIRLENVSILELILKPGNDSFASLAKCRVA
jgi:hypothetical protein